jgi:hypothetical protein
MVAGGPATPLRLPASRGRWWSLALRLRAVRSLLYHDVATLAYTAHVRCWPSTRSDARTISSPQR